MIYTGLNNTGEVEAIYGHLNGIKSEVSEVYGSIDYNDPIFYRRKTITGTSPLTFKGLGQPLKDCHIFGETVQDGTPSPDYPVDVQGVGERTENLFDKDSPDVVRRKKFDQSGNIVANQSSAITGYIPIKPDTFYSMFPKNGANGWYGVFYDSDKNQISTFNVSGGGDGNRGQYIYKSPSNASYARLTVLNTEYYGRTMYVEGTEELVLSNIIPYGYKIPVTIGNVTTPIYIGSDPLYRVGDYADEIDFVNQRLVRRIDPTTMQPYATPITSAITVPQLTAAVGDDALTVDTTVKPSAVSITGHIKPTGYGQLLDVNDVDIQDSTGEPIYIQG